MTYPAASVADTADPPHLLDQVAVLHARPLRPGTAPDQLSRFREPTWQLTPAMLQLQTRSRILNFMLIPPAHRAVAKELCYAMLSGPLPAAEARPGISSVLGVFAELARFTVWFSTRDSPGGQRIEDLSGADLLAYRDHLGVALPDKEMTRSRARAAIRRLWLWRHQLTADRLAFDPAHLDGWGEPHGRSRENRTERIPEQVLGPLLAWAHRFIDDFATDITAADCAYRRHLARTRAPMTGPRTRDVGHRLHRLLTDHLAHGWPLPGYRGRPNNRGIARVLDCDPGALGRYSTQIAAAAAVVGVTASSPLDTPITATLGGRPWIEAVTLDNSDHTHPATLAVALQAACYVVIAYLSGMRDSEIKHLRRGCLHTDRDPSGRPYRWKVASLAFKHETDPHGKPATWTVGHTVSRAVTALEALQPPGTDLLFAPLDTASGGAALSNLVSNKHLNGFISWINQHCQLSGRADAVPQVNGRTWRLTTRQFRRTLAWFIARRPGGSIAGVLQYRHHSIHMFEGYAGTSDSGFRAEVESETSPRPRGCAARTVEDVRCPALQTKDGPRTGAPHRAGTRAPLLPRQTNRAYTPNTT